MGNLTENPQAFLFFIEDERQTRIQAWETAEIIDDVPLLLEQLTNSRYKGKPERVIRFRVEAWAVNCRQYFHLRITSEETQTALQTLRDRIKALELENSALKAERQV